MLMTQRISCLRLLKSVRPKPLLFNTSTVQHVAQHPMKFMETQNWWKEKDKVSNQWQLIYKAPMEKVLNYATAYLTFSTVTVAGICLYYGVFLYEKNSLNTPLVLGNDVVIANSTTEGLIYLGAFILFHIAVKMVLSKYVVRLYQNGDNYLAIYRGHWYNSIVKHKFNLKDFKKLTPSMLITWSDARFSLGSRQGILFEHHFKTPQDFNYLISKKKVGSQDED